MAGGASYAYISAPSNTVIKRGFGRLYSITGNWPAGSTVRADASHSFGQGVLDLNANSSNTVGHFGANTVFGLGLLFDPGLVVAVSSNATITVEYE